MALFKRKDRQQFLLKRMLASAVFMVPGAEAVAAANNPEAVIPPQCYTKTDGQYNPCYICHQSHPKGTRSNAMADGAIQGEYSFSDLGVKNQWTNLFKSRAAEIAAIDDATILKYVREDNYTALLGSRNNPAANGYVPDLQLLQYPEQAFDEQGFARDGSGWVAFNYKPLPSTFWPTNGNFDDVIIRLPEEFRSISPGKPDNRTYLLNLSLLELAIKELDSIPIPAVDESLFGVDLNGDGVLGQADVLVVQKAYLGGASNIKVMPRKYPVGTEFLHSVRYLDIADDGSIQPSVRMKELRYSRKYKNLSDVAMRYAFNMEHREKAEGKLPFYSWAKPVTEAGMNNKMGWNIQGWIEDKSGQLRLQNYEENLFCMGCHTTIGTTIDSTFAFPRKVTGMAGWGYINLKGMPDSPSVGESLGEYLTYLQRVGGGDEFRQNNEMIERWFNNDGSVKQQDVEGVDVHTLITPSPERALALNKAYQRIVSEQSFSLGRDAVLGLPRNVYSEVDQDSVPVLPASRQFHYDLRLAWPETSMVSSSLAAVGQTNSHSASPRNELVLAQSARAGSGLTLVILSLLILAATGRWRKR